MILVDTSAWGEFLRGTGSIADHALAELLRARAPLRTTDGVVAELLAGAGDEEDAARLSRLAASVDRAEPASLLDLERAARLHRLCRDAGEPVPLAACLVAATAVRDGVEILAHGAAFQVLAARAGVRLHGAAEPVRSEAPAPPGAKPTPAGAPARTHRILLVEDDPGEAALLERVVAGAGRIVTLASSAAEAREALAAERPDLVVLDLVLPDADGRTLLAEIRRAEATREVRVIVLSGRGGARLRQECLAFGADAFLEKPVEPGALEAAIDRTLEAAGRGGAAPDPLVRPLSLRELQERLAAFRSEPGAPFVLALLQVRDGAGGGQAEGGSGTLASVLRRVVEALEQRMEPGDLLARWSADELLLVSERRSTDAVVALLDGVARAPGLRSRLLGRVRVVGRDEDLLDAVAAMATAPGPERDRVPVAVAQAARRERPLAALVEDDPITHGLVRHRLERSGFAVRHHEDGAEAWAAMQADPPDVAILDVQLPSMDGFEILGRMREHAPTRDVPVLVFTTLGREEHVARAFELGADDYVTKPFSPGELLTRVLRLVRRS